jgi:hypothetical protein
VRSRVFPDLDVTSTVRVYMEHSFCACSEQATLEATPVEADRLQWCHFGGVGLATNCLTTIIRA